MSFQSVSKNTLTVITTSSPIKQKNPDNRSKYLEMLSNNQTNRHRLWDAFVGKWTDSW